MSHSARGDWPDDGAVWEVYWFGQVKPGRVPSELTLDVSLRRISTQGAATEDFRTVSAGIGQIPSLHIGQRWRNGRLVGVATLDRFNHVVQIDPGSWRIIDAGANFSDGTVGGRKYLIPPYEYRLPKRMMSSRCIAFAVDGVADALIIPCIEVARAWYLRSTVLALRLTSGPFAEVRRQLYNDAYPANQNEGTPQVVLRTGLSQLDAATVAMLIHDLSAQDGVTRIMDSVARASAIGQDAFIEALPPIVGARRISARGRRFQSLDKVRFLVNYFNEVPYPDIGALLAWDLDNSNQNEGGDMEITRTAWPKKRSPIDATPDYQLRHEREPQTDNAPITESGHLPSFAGLPLLRRLPPRNQSSQSACVRPIAAPPPTNELSTGAGENTLDGPGQLQIRDIHDSSPEGAAREVFPAGFNSLLEVVAEIGSREEIRCRVVPGSDPAWGSSTTPRSLFPNYNSKPRGRWQLINGLPRQFLVIEVETPEGIAYAIEIERRTVGMEGRLNPESFALGLLVAADGRYLTLSEFGAIARACIDAQGVWPPMIGEAIQVQRLRHAYASCAAFADAILATVWGMLSAVHGDADDLDSQRQGRQISDAVG